MNFIRFVLDALSRPFQALFSLPIALFVTPRRLLGMSLPARAAILLAILMWLIIPAGFLAYVIAPDRADLVKWWAVVPLQAICATIAPLLVYWGLRWWLESQVSRFPEIDSDWRAGLSALRAQGLDLADLPIFLVIGPADARQTRAIFRASGLDFRVRAVPEDGNALQWYANSEGVFLALTDVGSSAYLREVLESTRDHGSPGEASSTQDDPSGSDSWPGNNAGMTAVVERHEPGSSRRRPDAARRGAQDEDSEPQASGPAMTAMIGGSAYVGQPVGRIDEGRLQEGVARVRHLMQLLKRSRQPVISINGVMVIVPLELLRRGTSTATLVKEGLGGDLRAIREAGQSRCPLTIVVGGLEKEPGFLELARRRGYEKARYRERVGRGARSLEDLWAPPTEERLLSIVTHACATFEDLVYDSFRKDDGYNKPGNFKLYSLLCAVRHEVSDNLNLLVRGVAALDEDSGEPVRLKHDGMLLNGCYFAATGSDESEQLYLAGVFQKVLDWCNEVQWTEIATQLDDRCHRWARWSLLIGGLLLTVIGVILFDWFV